MTEPTDATEHAWDATAVSAAADLGRRLAAAELATQPYDLHHGTALLARTVRDDEEIEIHCLEQYLEQPRRQRGSVTVYDPVHFADYVTRMADAQTVVWADDEARALTAVFNDHAPGPIAGWRDHRAVLRLRVDPDWKAWRDRDGKLGGQVDFAEFLEDQAGAIVKPDAATMREIATTFQAHRKAAFGSSTRLQSGDVQLQYSEDTTAKAGAKGNIEIPETFVVALAPFLGNEPAGISARLRYRIREGQLAIGYQLHRPDIAEREAFAEIRDQVAAALEAVPLYDGHAPGTVDAYL